MKKIFNLEVIREELDSQEWEDDIYESDCQTRQMFLGTVFQLLPSGKYYQPWACSNVEVCPNCFGTGSKPGNYPVRVQQRSKARYERLLRKAIRSGTPKKNYKKRQAALNRYMQTCSVCNGIGSKEAYDDECWYEQAEKELNSIGCSLTSGEGDPCDMFASECRHNYERQSDE